MSVPQSGGSFSCISYEVTRVSWLNYLTYYLFLFLFHYGIFPGLVPTDDWTALLMMWP